MVQEWGLSTAVANRKMSIAFLKKDFGDLALVHRTKWKTADYKLRSSEIIVSCTYVLSAVGLGELGEIFQRTCT